MAWCGADAARRARPEAAEVGVRSAASASCLPRQYRGRLQVRAAAKRISARRRKGREKMKAMSSTISARKWHTQAP